MILYKPGTYVLWEERCDVRYYWRGALDGLSRPKDSANIMLACLFVSARHAYVAAKPYRQLLDWKTRWIGPPGYRPGPDWDAHFCDRLMRQMFTVNVEG